MKIGLFGYNVGAVTTPETATRVAVEADAAGFESLFVAEHMIVPSPQVPPSPMAPEQRILDPLLSLTWAAANTMTMRLVTGIVLLPQRHPVQLAKEVATLDVLSGGRVELGVGVGYLPQEFAAVGVPMADRGRRTDEYLGVLRTLWEDDAPCFDGEFVSFSGVDTQPRPVQTPLPIVMGGHSPPAYRRAATFAQGWYGFRRSVDQTASDLAALRAACDAQGRSMDGLEISVTADTGLDQQLVQSYAALGVHRMVVPTGGNSLAAVLATIEAMRPDVLLA